MTAIGIGIAIAGLWIGIGIAISSGKIPQKNIGDVLFGAGVLSLLLAIFM